MESNSSVKNKVDAAINSIEKMDRAMPSPWFYTKVIQHVNHSRTTLWEKIIAFLLVPRVVFAMISFIIMVNAFVLYSNFSSHPAPPDLTELNTSDEYSLAANSLYDLETEKP